METLQNKMPLIAGNDNVTAWHWRAFIICFTCDMVGGTVSTLMSVYLPVVASDLRGTMDEATLGNISAYINALYIFGWMFGGVAFGLFSDKWGRVRAVILSASCYAVFTLFISVAVSWQWVVACRFISGFGVGGVLVSSTTLIAESWSARTRAIAIGILSIAFPIGIFSAGLINYLIADWRQAFMIGFIPLVVAIISLWLVKESAPWKLSKAQVLTAKIKHVLLDDYRKDLIIGSITFGTMLIGLWAIFSWLPTWVQSLLGTVDGQHARGLSMMLLGGGGLIGGFASGWISNALGLRKTMIICYGGCLVMSFLLFKVNVSFSLVIYIETAGLALFFGVSQGVLSAYIPQLFPLLIRATATGFCFNVGRLFTATAVFFVGTLVNVLGGYGNAIFSFSMIFLVGLIALFFGKESTSSPNLEHALPQPSE